MAGFFEKRENVHKLSHRFWKENEVQSSILFPFDYNGSNDRDLVQNGLVRQYNFPHIYNAGDDFVSNYHDRILGTDMWKEACEILKDQRQMVLDSLLKTIPATMFLKYCIAMCGSEYIARLPKEKQLHAVGCRFMHHTNVSTGYPVYTAEVYLQHESNKGNVKLFSDENAPNVIHVNYNCEEIKRGPSEYINKYMMFESFLSKRI